MQLAHRFFSTSFVMVALGLGLGCSDDAQPRRDGAILEASTPDAGPDQGPSEDAMGDGGSDLTSTADQGGGSCKAGLDVAPLTLATGYCVGARLTLPTSLALAFDGSTLWTAENGTSARRFVLRARSLDRSMGILGQPLDIFDFEVAGTAQLYAGAYLASWPPAGRLAFGYTLDDQSGAVWSGGGSTTPLEIAAQGNYDAIYLDADTLLINGLGAGAASEGQGVYVFVAGAGRRLIKDVGTYSGFLARGDNVVYAGGFSTQNELWAFTKAELLAAIAAKTTLSGTTDGDVIYAGAAIDAAALGDDLLVIDDDFVAFKALRRVAVTVSGDTVTKGSVGDVVVAGTDTSIKPTEVAMHGGWIGLRLVGGANDELVLLKAE